ncbi:MAG TPA: LamG-like jellyroll fold domain-containing protein, partial [Verrucomicrobiae bacterium]|nr:LamG-like jellyroll fold domain-containing protein [Verrucomicrobiae bacterium]
MNQKLITLFIVFVISLSSISFANATYDVTASNENNIVTNHATFYSQEKQISNHPQNRELILSEKLNVNTNDGRGAIDQSQKSLELYERLSITVNDNSENIVFVMRDNSDRITSLDKISSIERIRFNGRALTVSSNAVHYDHPEEFINYKISDDILNNISDNSVTKTDDLKESHFKIITDGISLGNPNSEQQIITFVKLVKKDLVLGTHDITGLHYQYLLFISSPISGFLVARAIYDSRFDYLRSRQFNSSWLIVILISSSAISPISISHHYWGYAYAQIQNDSSTYNNTIKPDLNFTIPHDLHLKSANSLEINTTNSTLTEPLVDKATSVFNKTSTSEEITNSVVNIPITESLGLEEYVSGIPHNNTNPSQNSHVNSTSSELSDSLKFSDKLILAPNDIEPSQSSPSDTLTISDDVILILNGEEGPPQLRPTDQIIFSTHITLVINNFQIVEPPLSDSLIFSDGVNLNATNIVPTRPTTSGQLNIVDVVLLSVEPLTIPNATNTWRFGIHDNTTNSVGKIRIENDTNGSSLELQGNGYLKSNVNSTKSISSLTIAAWVKPDYSHGSPRFTVISKERQFDLSINNIIDPQRIATFSVFDGIKWQTVNSTIPIGENWTYLVATFNGSSISIYVNGTYQSSLQTIGIPSLDLNGQLTTKTIQNINSSKDIIIGAQLETIRSITPSNLFSGLIKEVKLYDTQLTPEQIALIFEKTDLSVFTQTVSVLLNNYNIQPIDKIFFLDTITLNSTGNHPQTNSTNATQNISISPTLTSIKSGYELAEKPAFELQLYNDSSLMKRQQIEMTKMEVQVLNAQSKLNDTGQALSSTNSNSTENKAITHAKLALDKAQQKIEQAQGQIQKAITNIANQGEKTAIAQREVRKANEEIISALEQFAETQEQINNASLNIPISGKIASIGTSLRHPTPANNSVIQNYKWIDSNETITVQTLDPGGKEVAVLPQIRKEMDGKFEIELYPPAYARPGIYTIKTTLVINGSAYTTENRFQWGLVSLNTEKSTYRPGETANFVIVVLDAGGHSVCNSNIQMNVTDPNSLVTTLTSDNGITRTTQCGIYNSKYTTGSEGNYTVDISASNPSGIATFSTYFSVQQNFSYDIIRTAASKIDPVTGQNLFGVTINITSFVGPGPVIIRESVPSSFSIATDGKVDVVNDTKIITWERTLDSNKQTSVSYKYSVPIEFPRLYALGRVQVQQNNGPIFTEARNWYVAVDPAVISSEDGIVAYRSTTGTSTSNPKIRTWSRTGSGSWGSEVELTSAGSPIRDLVLKYSPVSGKIVLVTLSDDGFLDAYVCTDDCGSSGSWTYTSNIGKVWSVAPAVDSRRYDVAFERTTGNAIVAYGVVDTNTAHDIAYKVLPAASTSFGGISEQYINDASKATDIQYTWIEMDSKPVTGSNEIVLAGFDSTDSDTNAFVWDGSAWGNFHNLGTGATATGNHEAVAVRYASDGSKALAAAGDGTTGNVASGYWSSGAWTTVAAVDTSSGTNTDVQYITLKADPSSTAIQMVVVLSGNDMNTGYWSGAAWTIHGATSIDVNTDSSATRVADFAWNPTGSTGMLVWDTDGAGNTISSVFCNPQCTNAIQTNATWAGTGGWMSLYTNPASGGTSVQILGLRMNNAINLGSFHWDGSKPFTNYGDSALTASVNVVTYSSFSFDFRHTAKTMSLTESLPLVDTIQRAFPIKLAETLPITATVIASKLLSLSGSLPLSDSVSKIRILPLTNSLPLVAAYSTVGARVFSLAESLPLSASESNTHIVTITDTLPITDTISKTFGRVLALSESLPFVATYSRITDRIFDLSASLPLSDTESNTHIVTIADSLPITSTESQTA